MKTIYLHIGRGKTGTTAIQQQLPQLRQFLLANSIDYLQSDNGARGAGHQNFGKSFITRLPDYMLPPNNPEQVLQTLSQEIKQSSAQKVVISSENLELADASLVRQYLDQLGIEYTPKIVFFVRSQDELAESEFNQLVKLKRESRLFSQYALEEAASYYFLKTALHWESAFGKDSMVCRIYDAGQRNVVEQFLACIGCPEGPVQRLAANNAQQSSINSSISYLALSVSKLLNASTAGNFDLAKRDIQSQLQNSGPPALLFDNSEAATYRDLFSQDNIAFTERYLHGGQSDLGGRRYSEDDRRIIRQQIRELGLPPI